jgi:hypothetical protein
MTFRQYGKLTKDKSFKLGHLFVFPLGDVVDGHIRQRGVQISGLETSRRAADLFPPLFHFFPAPGATAK